MKTMIYKTAALAGGLAMATAVIAQTQMRTAPSPSAVGQVQMAPATSGDIAYLKARLNADEAAMTTMQSKIDALKSRFEGHTHSLMPGKSAYFVAIAPCKDTGQNYGGNTANCQKFWAGGGTASIAPRNADGPITYLPTATSAPDK